MPIARPRAVRIGEPDMPLTMSVSASEIHHPRELRESARRAAQRHDVLRRL
jgi:hypothetical protein